MLLREGQLGDIMSHSRELIKSTNGQRSIDSFRVDRQ
jgi:hypothetical protein